MTAFLSLSTTTTTTTTIPSPYKGEMGGDSGLVVGQGGKGRAFGLRIGRNEKAQRPDGRVRSERWRRDFRATS